MRLALALGERLGRVLVRGEHITEALASEAPALGTPLSQEMIDFALANAGDAPVDARANKLGFLLLSLVPSSPIAVLLAAVANRAFRRAGPAFGPLIDADDLLSLLRWKVWGLPAEHFAPDRVLRHPGLAAYLSVVARRIVIDECRAMDRVSPSIEPESIEVVIDPRSSLDEILADLDLLRRFASELPEWEAPLVDVLAGEVERDAALKTINRKREGAGLPAWTADSMRTGVHRARKRLRELMIRTPSKSEPLDRASVVIPQVHDWRRFWCSREGSYSLHDGGFLVDPETELGRHVHGAVATERLEAVPCLVLLGEPGIGKSTVIRQERQRLSAERKRATLVDLSRMNSGGEIRAAVERACATSTRPVFLFLDALDEGLSRNVALTNDLIAIVESLDVARVHLRIACRTLKWPTDLEEAMRKRYGAEATRVQELLPLRRIDVVAAANDHGTAGTEFVEQVRERDAVALAIRPISLRFLLAMFAVDGALPHSKSRLYDEGSVILCTEEGALQRGRSHRNADAYRRRAIAARLAAVSIFSNRDTIVRNGVPADGALPADIAVGVEQLLETTYSIDTGAVEDVLTGTALFTARTATTFGWNHQSYREYLAAWYVAQHAVGNEVADRLYFPNGLGHVPGPLREVAAWHATFVPALFDQLVDRDPEVLLHSDGAALSDESRAQLVRALLDRMARYEALDRYYRRDYRKLKHTHLADQLRPYIADLNANIIVRRAAMDIAWSCGERGVVDELTAVLLNREDDLQAREVAARALAKLGGDPVRDLFLALLAAGIEPDANDIIRGSVLGFLWPDHIDAATLVRHLPLPKRDDLLGSYQTFIMGLSESIAPDQLATALEWVEGIDGHGDFHVQHAQHGIIERALRFVEREDVRAALARIIRASLRTHVGAWYAHGPARHRDERTLAPSERRLLVLDLLRAAGESDEEIGSELVFFDPPLLAADDIVWLADLTASATEHVQRLAGRCVAALYFRFGYPTDALVADAVVSVEAPAFQEALRSLFQPVELGSDLAHQLAANWARVRRPPPTESEANEDDEKDESPVPNIWAVVSPLLARIEAGELIAWVDFARWTDGLPNAIAENKEWTAIRPEDRERILIAASRYLQGVEAPDVAWMDVPNAFPWTAVAARSALQLLATTRPAMLDALGDTVWRKWSPVLVAVPFPTLGAPELADLIRRSAAYEELTAAIVRVARRENRPGGHVFVLSSLPESVPEPLHEPLLRLAPELQDDGFEDVLERLVPANNQEARELARVAVRELAPQRAARAARVLLPHEAAQWPVVIKRMQKDRDFLAAFAPLVAYREDMRDDVFRTLGAQAAAELALVLLRQFPDGDYRGPRGQLMLPDYLDRLRRRVIGMLSDAGTPEGIRALEWLRDQEPTRDELRFVLIEARRKLADTAWQPASVEDVKAAVLGGGRNVSRDSSSEVVPLVVPASPPRRDVGREEMVALYSSVAILVETATPTETAALHAAMQPLQGEKALIVGSGGFATYTIGRLGNYAVAHFQTEMGSESPNGAPLATSDAIAELRPKLLLQVGIAFGLQPAKQRLGDVLIAQHITSYEMVKLKPDSLEERGETMRADAMLIERIRAHGRTWRVSRGDESTVAFHVGQVLSGAKLVNNRAFRDALVRRFPAAIGGEMEGIGAYAAAFRHRVPVLLVKAICDWADGAKDDRAQSFAAFTAADLVRHVFFKPDVLAPLGIENA